MPEDMAASLENVAYHLQPFVDAIHDRFGMCVSVLLAGPIGIRGGRIGVQSVHAGKIKGLSPANWPTFDWAGFCKVENTMITFAKQCFYAECQGPWAAPLLASPPVPNGTAPAASSTRSVTATLAPPNVQMGNSNVEGGDKQSGLRGGMDEGPAADQHNEHWQRTDCLYWTAKLMRAHLFDFEAAWGYVDEGPHLRREHCPQQVNGWLTMGRKWSLPPTLGADLGTRDREDLWIGEITNSTEKRILTSFHSADKENPEKDGEDEPASPNVVDSDAGSDNEQAGQKRKRQAAGAGKEAEAKKKRRQKVTDANLEDSQRATRLQAAGSLRDTSGNQRSIRRKMNATVGAGTAGVKTGRPKARPRYRERRDHILNILQQDGLVPGESPDRRLSTGDSRDDGLRTHPQHQAVIWLDEDLNLRVVLCVGTVQKCGECSEKAWGAVNVGKIPGNIRQEVPRSRIQTQQLSIANEGKWYMCYIRVENQKDERPEGQKDGNRKGQKVDGRARQHHTKTAVSTEIIQMWMEK
ncbi:hypothetical protein C8R45DRAFT_934145 [Mycena sanguinolenta]|nr:hypothetical protein C8R45DRAFT_934145 [Mycena sanguinolenta]